MISNVDGESNSLYERAMAAIESADASSAIELLKGLDESGDSRAAIWLGFVLEIEVLCPEPKSRYELANEYFRRALDMGYVQANLGLGRAYYLGKGEDIDFEQSLSYFSAYESLGMTNAVATFYLGCHYLYGKGVDPDLEKAKFYFQRSFRAGYHFGLVGLAVAHRLSRSHFSMLRTTCLSTANYFKLWVRGKRGTWQMMQPFISIAPAVHDDVAWRRQKGTRWPIETNMEQGQGSAGETN